MNAKSLTLTQRILNRKNLQIHSYIAKKPFIINVLILLSFASFTYAQNTFDFESNTQQYLSGPDESTVTQTVNGVTLTIRTDNETSHTKYTQITDLEGVVAGVSGNAVTTSWRNNTFYFEFSEPVYLGTILTGRIGAGYIQQVVTDDTVVPIRTTSANHTGTTTIALGWENVTAFKIENDVSITAIPVFDDISFIPMTEFVNTQTYVPDDTFEQYLIDNGWDDVLDDYVATPNIAFQNYIYLQGVEDLTGIEDFSNLIYFNCLNSPNLVGELDLTNNLNLEVVQLSNSQITNLNLAANSALQYVTASNSLLTNISLPTNANLIRVELKNNNLTTLDFSYYPLMEHLELDNNNLTSLNFSNGNNNDVNYFSATGNPDLSCIEVSNVAYATTNYTLVDDGVIFSADCSSLLSNDEVVIEDFSLFPNPTTSTLHIKATQDVDYLLIDITGKIVASGKFVIGDNSVNLTRLESGLFFLKMRYQQKVISKKIMKK